jgi:hypothetical protein
MVDAKSARLWSHAAFNFRSNHLDVSAVSSRTR